MGTPSIIQGGMGVGVSSWRLARAVAEAGQLGTVSGTAIGVVVARRLQRGDPDGSVRRALEAMPLPGVAERVVERYYVPGGIPPDAAYKAVPAFTSAPRRPLIELTVAGSFVEVFLAKEGHSRPIGVNLLHKVRLPTPTSLYGAMLAGVDYVAMGAGIPRDIPAMLDTLSRHEAVSIPLDIAGATTSGTSTMTFDPRSLWERLEPPAIERPRFLAIIGSATLATALHRDEHTRPDGFVLESNTAGGHNAPPRGRLKLSQNGEPIYGPRDEIDVAGVVALGLPVWLAGGHARPDALEEALSLGAAGVQIGTAFAFCRESGIDPTLKAAVVARAREERSKVFTHPAASPTGFPFKVAEVEGTLSDPEVYTGRSRRCDLGFLTTPYERPDGSIGFRCPSEPVADYVRKGGDPADTEGRVCLCNGLVATAGLGQRRADGSIEPPVVTAGDDLEHLARLLPEGTDDYGADDVIAYVLGDRRTVGPGS